MLTDLDIEFTFAGTPGLALVWVIDGQCLYDLPMSLEHAAIFQAADQVLDISLDYPSHDGIVVRLLENGEPTLELATSEYFGSVLLSNPLVLRLGDYPNGRFVESPHATFDGESFTITDRNVGEL